MARLLFTSLPLHGHLDWGGMLATAAELARRGHQVAWASEPPVEAAVTTMGVEFMPLGASGWHPLPPLPANLSPQARQQRRRRRALDSWLHPATVTQAVEALRAAIAGWQPHLVVAEPTMAAAALAAEVAALPFAVCGRPALPDVSPARLGPADQRIAQLCQATGVGGRNWAHGQGQIRSPRLHIDFFCRRWYADLPEIAPQTRFVGGQAGRIDGVESGDPPTVLITLGSLFRDDPGFFRIAAEAVMLEGGEPLVVTGRQARGDERRLRAALPAGTKMASWVDFELVLPGMAAIVHHGGVGTTHAALRHALPQAIVPRAGDQLAQAGRITQAGSGFGVRPADFTPANARWFVRQLLTDQALRDQARTWRQELGDLGGLPAAVDALVAASDPACSMV